MSFKEFGTVVEKNKNPSFKEFGTVVDDSSFGKFKRGAKRTGADILTTIAGAPGDILSIIDAAAIRPIYQGITGKEGVSYEKTPLGKILPPGHILQENLSEELKPQTPDEETVSEFVRDVTGLVGPGILGKAKGAVTGIDFLKKFGKRLLKASGLSITGIGAEKSAKALGVDEDTARMIKTGLVFAGDLGLQSGTQGGAKGYINELYGKMRNSRAVDASIDARKLEQRALKLKKQLESGGTSPSSAKSLKKVDEILESIESGNGRVSLQELEDFGIKTNELKSGLYEEFSKDKKGRALAKKNLNDVTGLIESGIDEYGSANSEYGKYRKEAKAAFGALEKSKKASNFLSKYAKKIGPTGFGATVISAAISPSSIVPIALGGAVGTAGIKGSELINRIVKSPELREYYLNVLDAAFRQDSAFLTHNLSKLNKEAEKHPEIFDDIDK
jgi:hypothetical protein